MKLVGISIIIYIIKMSEEAKYNLILIVLTKILLPTNINHNSWGFFHIKYVFVKKTSIIIIIISFFSTVILFFTSFIIYF